MENLLNSSVNKLQAIIKLEIAKNNLKAVKRALNMHDRSKVEKAELMLQEVLQELIKERESGFIKETK